jgi:HJR/Mrr/RecB family endonuclease
MPILSDLGFRLGKAVRGLRGGKKVIPSSPAPIPVPQAPQDSSRTSPVSEVRRREREVRQQQDKRELEVLVAKHSELISQFYKITERKVSLLDEYGDENWKALPKEVEIVLEKIAQREGISRPRFSVVLLFDLKPYLIASFKEYHQREQEKSINKIDYSKMSGADFELYLVKLLKQYGFLEIEGTPATGDQGADLIAKKNGRTIIIQAKRYDGAVGNKAVQEVASAVSYYGGDEGWVMTNSTYTKSARDLAQKAGIRLFGGRDLERFSELCD